MKVFVTGGTGGLGCELLAHLLHDKHQITVLSRSKAPVAGLARTVQGNLLNPKSYAAALQGQDVVLHLAALTHSIHTDLYYAVNTRGTELLLEAAAQAGVQRFIFVSTRAVGAACGAYGESKAMAEDAVRASGLAWTILRPSEVYSASRPQDKNELEQGRKNPGGEAVDRMIEAVRRWPMVPYVAHPHALLAPAYRADIVAAIAASLDCQAAVGKTYLLAGPDEMTQIALAKRLMRHLGRHRPLMPVPVFLLRLVACCAQLLRLPHPPFVPDQISRLLCKKESTINMARRDLDFAPRGIEQILAD